MSWSRLLHIGSVLVLVAPFATAQEMYTVEPGDTLSTLAERYGVSVDSILAANMLTGSDLMAGAVLNIPSTDTYTVSPGDTLSGVSGQTGIPVEELMALNGLNDTTLIIGQELILGGAAPSEPLIVEIEPGDSLWSLAERYGVPVDSLSSANGLTEDAFLSVGDSLMVPGIYADAVPSDQGGGAEPRVTVEAGQSLSQIAEQHGTSVGALMALNSLDSDLLNPGDTLLLPPAAGAGASDSFIWPLEGVITSYFGPRSLLGMTYHYGLDIDGVTGDPIMAAMSGTVTYSGWNGGYGYCVVIERDGVEYYYAHASELDVSVGEEVSVGDVIAKVGSTGRSTGSHLHFEIRIDGQSVDPLPYLERTASLP